jgi:hypothetical protein
MLVCKGCVCASAVCCVCTSGVHLCPFRAKRVVVGAESVPQNAAALSEGRICRNV